MAALSPLGARTLAGFVKRYGAQAGKTKFEAAMANGTIDRLKMQSQPSKSDRREGELEAAESTSGMPANKRTAITSD